MTERVQIDGFWYDAETADDLTSDMLAEYREELAQLDAVELKRKLRSLSESIDSADWELTRLERKRKILVYAVAELAARARAKGGV